MTNVMTVSYWRCVTMSVVLCVQPIVGTTQRLTMTKRRESIVNVDVIGTDRCTMGTERSTVTSGPRWYRTHAERGRRETE
jgi:hypothetical protein